nr:uncharacterized protein LOC109155677 [Ipomoea trifida]
MLPCHGRDAITTGSSLVTEGATLVSDGKRFELGFFLDEENSNWYAGIWYYKLNPQTIVWVANRDFPVQDSEGAVAIKEDGNLCVVDNTGATYFSTQLDPTPSKSHRTARTARLLDSGNLVLIDDLSGETLWQSFDNPADTFLPGMKMDEGFTLTSWASSGYNPTPGNYTFSQDPGDKEQYIIYNRSVTYWKSGVGDQLTSLNSFPPAVSSLLSNFTPNAPSSHQNLSPNMSSSLSSYHYPRLLMNSSGEIQFYSWDRDKTSWSLQWSEPHDRCSVYNVCGKFGTCSNNNNGLLCKCLLGFEPTNSEDWGANVFSGGCSRKSAISCNQNAKRDTFLNLTSVVFGNPDLAYPNAKTEEDCRQECLNNCQCQAYSYTTMDPTRRQRGTGDLRHECRIWTSEVIALQQDIANGLNLSVRIAIPDIELTRRDCRPCGLNMIPYPLSAQPGCGDPLYYSFSCNQSTGDLSFQTLNASYPVISDISLINRSFVIEVPVEISNSCNTRNRADGVILLNSSLPFNVKNWCYNDTGHLLSQGKNSIEISWNPPSEPTCSASTDCEDWPNSICNYTEQGQGRCLCKSGFKWDALSLNCSSVMTLAGSSSERNKSSVKFRSVIISISVILAVVILCSIGCIIYRRNLVRKRKDKRIVGNQLNNLANIGDQEDELLTEDDKKAIDIPFFSLETILAATEDFSDANKLGQGGFGPVYKVV